jgi:hypothetical protein
MEKGKKVNWSANERDMLISKCEDATVVTGKFSSSVKAADKVRFWVDVTERYDFYDFDIYFRSFSGETDFIQQKRKSGYCTFN